MNSTPKFPASEDKRCGSYAGAQAHYKRDEALCQSCREAKYVYSSSRRNASRDEHISKDKVYYQKNKESRVAWARNYRKANSAVIAERRKKANINNPDAVRRAAMRHKARKRNTLAAVYTEKQVISFYGSDCYLCHLPIDFGAKRKPGQIGWEYSFHIDHVVPISKGGADNFENVRPSHGLCNLRKGTSLIKISVAS